MAVMEKGGNEESSTENRGREEKRYDEMRAKKSFGEKDKSRLLLTLLTVQCHEKMNVMSQRYPRKA